LHFGAFALWLDVMMQTPRFLSSVDSLEGVCAGFVGRIPGVEGSLDKDEVVKELEPFHQAAVRDLGFDWSQLHLAEQVHGADISIVGKGSASHRWPDVDGLITADAGVLLGIHVADCGAVYMVDPVRGVLALLHSGKKGTEANISGKAVAMMAEHFGSKPADMVVALAPCIRPPVYEVDFAAGIRQQVLDAGVPEGQFTDSGICTSSDPEAYYSYRVERGKTGRMLALLGRL
jgi:copper oxidase (laccase) domain-containing protein